MEMTDVIANEATFNIAAGSVYGDDVTGWTTTPFIILRL